MITPVLIPAPIVAAAIPANPPPPATLTYMNDEPKTGLMDVEEDSIDPDFSFVGRVRTLSPQELRELIEQATYGMEADHPLKRALLRGIGVHHSGLPTKYRQIVEILFRCRYLRVVIATGTRLCHLHLHMHLHMHMHMHMCMPAMLPFVLQLPHIWHWQSLQQQQSLLCMQCIHAKSCVIHSIPMYPAGTALVLLAHQQACSCDRSKCMYQSLHVMHIKLCHQCCMC